MSDLVGATVALAARISRGDPVTVLDVGRAVAAEFGYALAQDDALPPGRIAVDHGRRAVRHGPGAGALDVRDNRPSGELPDSTRRTE